jgi:hypothetical protein
VNVTLEVRENSACANFISPGHQRDNSLNNETQKERPKMKRRESALSGKFVVNIIYKSLRAPFSPDPFGMEPDSFVLI